MATAERSEAGDRDDFAEVRAGLRARGLVAADEIPRATPLAGGVSSDIWRVDAARGSFCVKRARARLRVDAVWEAPVTRNASEADWLAYAARVVPEAVPRLLAHAPEQGWFAMEWLDPATHPVWKTRLLAGEVDASAAAELTRRLGRVHAASAADTRVREAFAHDALFEALRLEPYLRATARVHPALARRLLERVETWQRHGRALVHGDVSPKNVLLGPRGPLLLDAECACWGDPAFDVAFLATHLVLKAVWIEPARDACLAALEAARNGYGAHVDWEDPDALDARAAHWLPALLLARVDGKSPVEYLDEAARARVRDAALAELDRDGAGAGDLRETSLRFVERAA